MSSFLSAAATDMPCFAAKLEVSTRRQRKPRLAIQLPVRIWGMTAAGSPFIQLAQTLNISLHGVCVAEVKPVVLPSEILGLSYQERKGRYRVVWAERAVASQSALLGLHALDLESDIWRKDFSLVSDTTRLVERRGAPRFACEGSVSLWQPGKKHPIFTAIADISLHGCYVNLMTPLPVASELSLLLNVDEAIIRAAASVRTSHPGVGMGLQFAAMEAAGQLALQELIARLAQRSTSSSANESTDTVPLREQAER